MKKIPIFISIQILFILCTGISSQIQNIRVCRCILQTNLILSESNFIPRQTSLKNTSLNNSTALLKHVWIIAGTYSYKLWHENEKVYIQRYCAMTSAPTAKKKQIPLNKPFFLGSAKTFLNILPSRMYVKDPLLSKKHLCITVSEGPEYFELKIHDYSSTGTSIIWLEPSKKHLRKNIVQISSSLSAIKHIHSLSTQYIKDFRKKIGPQLNAYFKDEKITNLIKEFRKGTFVLDNRKLNGKFLKYTVKFDSAAIKLDSAGTECDLKEYLLYKTWEKFETLKKQKNSKAALAQYTDLFNLLHGLGKKLYLRTLPLPNNKKNQPPLLRETDNIPPYPDLFEQIYTCIKLIPSYIILNPELRGICLQSIDGGAHSGGASSYENHVIHMHESLSQMPACVYLAVFFHELGHSIHDGLETGYFKGIKPLQKSYEILKTSDPNYVFLGTEYLKGSADKIYQQALSFDQFTAELNMLYICQGNRLRNYINQIPQKNIRKAYITIYKIFRNNIYRGREYYEAGEEFTSLKIPRKPKHSKKLKIKPNKKTNQAI